MVCLLLLYLVPMVLLLGRAAYSIGKNLPDNPRTSLYAALGSVLAALGWFADPILSLLGALALVEEGPAGWLPGAILLSAEGTLCAAGFALLVIAAVSERGAPVDFEEEP